MSDSTEFSKVEDAWPSSWQFVKLNVEPTTLATEVGF